MAATQEYLGTGRRKTAVARVRIFAGAGDTTVNTKALASYFPLAGLRALALAPIQELQMADKYHITITVVGGGIHAQADAVRHGLARALAIANPDVKKRLRVLGFMTRDSRMVERKKYGLKKARRAPQWSKR